MASSIIIRGRGLCYLLLCAMLWSMSVHCGTAVQSAGMAGVSTAAQKPGPSVLSLFNLKKASKFWSDDVMTHVNEDFTLPEKVSLGKDALKNYTQAVNVARYLGFKAVDAIHFPIPVNFVFIGFDGEGNYQLKLGGDELERWFRDIDHIVEHTRIPQLGESLSPFYRVQADGEQRHHLPLVSNVHYNYSVHVVELGASARKVIEKAVTVFARKENVADMITPSGDAIWQVDMDSVEHILSSLADYLELNDAYTVFIVNPKRDLTRGRYGYRRGLSESEVKQLGQDAKLKAEVQKNWHKHHDVFEEVDKTLKRPLYSRHPLLRFAFTTADDLETAQWGDAYLKSLESHSEFIKSKKESEVTVFQAQQILQMNSEISVPLRKYLTEEQKSFRSDCLTDTWVSRSRWAFVDLTAGPFTWGPTVGGEGVRLSNGLPSVERSFDNVTWNGNVESDEVLQQDVQMMVQDRFSSFGEDDASATDMLMAELDVYEMFAVNHCSGRKIRLALCEGLQEKIEDIREELQSYQNEEENEEEKKRANEILKRIDGWSMFNDIHEHTQAFSVSRDRFLSHLGATLSNAMKHVLTSSTADGAFHFYEKIYFRVYVITEEKTKITKSAVDEVILKRSLSTLILPHQKAEFSIQRPSLSEDSALAMAFSTARRVAVLPVLALNATERIQQRVYLDSVILQHQLQHTSLSVFAEKKFQGRRVLEVPIFWLVQSGEPLFIDKHFLAKALPDMVIVVQSDNSAWESHLQCNNQSITWDLSHPLGAAIAATAEHLGGLVPAHTTYSHAHENAIQDWTWSTGCHPFSSTGWGSELSQLHRDALARSYIVTALDESIAVVNEAIEILAKEQTHEATFQTLKERELLLLHQYNLVVNMWKQIVRVGEQLRFEDAIRQLGSLEDASTRFLTIVEATIEALHPIHCTRKRKIDKEANTFAGLAIVAVVLLLWCFLRPRRRKPKLN